MSDNILLLSEIDPASRTIFVKGLVGNIQYKSNIESIKAKGFLSGQQTAELLFLETLITKQIIKPNTIVETENAEDLTEFVESETNTLTEELQLEAKFITNESFRDSKVELLRLGTNTLDISRPERQHVALTTCGLFQISLNALNNAKDLIHSLASFDDLTRYLGEHTAEWTSRADEIKKTRYFQCGHLAFLVDFNTGHKRLPIIVYSFSATNLYTSAEVKYLDERVFLTYDEWCSFFNIVELNDANLVSDYSMNVIRGTFKKLGAKWYPGNRDTLLLKFKDLEFDLQFDSEGQLINSEQLLGIGQHTEPKWRKAYESSIGKIRITKRSLKKLSESLKLEANSKELVALLERAFEKAPIKESGRTEFILGSLGLKVIQTESEYLVVEVVPASSNYFTITTRLGKFRLPKHGIVADNFKRSFGLPSSVELTQEKVNQLTSGEVTLKVDPDTGFVDTSAYKSKRPIYFTESKVVLHLARKYTNNVIGDLLEVNFSESIRSDFNVRVGDVSIEVPSHLMKKAVQLAKAKSGDYLIEAVLELESALTPSIVDDGFMELAIPNTDYMFLVNSKCIATDILLSKQKLFLIKNDDFSFVIKRNSGIEPALWNTFRKQGLAKSYQASRSLLAKSKISTVSKVNDFTWELFFEAIGVTLTVATIKSKGMADYPTPSLVSFKFN